MQMHFRCRARATLAPPSLDWQELGIGRLLAYVLISDLIMASPDALIQALRSSKLRLGLGNKKKVIHLYLSGHRLSKEYWPKQQGRAPRVFFFLFQQSVTVCPALLTRCCCSACKADFSFMRVPRAFLFKAPNAVD